MDYYHLIYSLPKATLAWLMGFMLTHVPYDILNATQCQYVYTIQASTDKGNGGCYDICLERAEKIGDGLALNWNTNEPRLVNACAVILSGAEF
jgi:hypothetical protein